MCIKLILYFKHDKFITILFELIAGYFWKYNSRDREFMTMNLAPYLEMKIFDNFQPRFCGVSLFAKVLTKLFEIHRLDFNYLCEPSVVTIVESENG